MKRTQIRISIVVSVAAVVAVAVTVFVPVPGPAPITDPVSSAAPGEPGDDAWDLLGEIRAEAEVSPSVAVRETVAGAIARIAAGEVRVQIVDWSDRRFVGGAEFDFDPNGSRSPVLRVDNDLLTSDGSRRGLAMAVVVHELRHVHDYFTRPARFRSARPESIAALAFEMDAHFVEASFVAGRPRSSGTGRTGFENLLTASLSHDRLATVAALMRSTDLELIQTHHQAINHTVAAGSRDAATAAFVAEGVRLLSDGPPESDRWNAYRWYVRLLTWDRIAAALGPRETTETSAIRREAAVALAARSEAEQAYRLATIRRLESPEVR